MASPILAAMDHLHRTLSVALLGAGLFATNSHAPVLLHYTDTFTTKVVWSHWGESTARLAAKLSCNAFSGEDNLMGLIARPNIDAFIVALPLDKQPGLVSCLLGAGKHVLSKKPIAPTVAKASAL
jgi:predicted dehydrogenase